MSSSFANRIRGVMSNMVLIGIGFGVLSWLVEALVHVLVFHEEATFVQQVFVSAPHEIWMRSLVAGLFVVLGVYSHVVVATRKRVGQALRQAHDELERRVKERTAELATANARLSQEIAGHERATEALLDSQANLQMMYEALQESEDQLAGIVQSVTDHMSMIDREYNILWANDVARRLFGPDLIKKKCRDVYHCQAESCESCVVRRVFEDGQVHEHETDVVRADGETIRVWRTASVAGRDADGQPEWVIEVSRDITERVRTEKALRESERQYRVELERRVVERTAELTTANEQLSREIAERKQVEEALRVQRDLAVTLGAASDLMEILNCLLEAAFQLEGIDCGGVYLVDELTGALDLVTCQGFPPEFAENISHYEADSAHARLVMAGVPLHQRYPGFQPDVHAQIRQRDGLRSLSIVPVQCEGQVVAVLNLASHTHDELPASVRSTIGTIATQIGGTIARVQAEEALRQRNRELALLNRIGQVINSTLDLDQVFATVLDEVCGLLNAAIASIWLIDLESDELVCRQATGPYSEVVCGWRLASGEGLAGWVTHTGQSLIVPDAHVDKRHSRNVEQQTGLTLRSILTVPLRVKGNVIGVLQAADLAADRFKPTVLPAVESLAASAASAIENARLYQEIRATHDYSQTVLNSLHDEVMLIDREYVVTDVNAAFLHKTGYTREEVIGQYCYRLSHQQNTPCDSPEHPCPVAEVWRTSRSARGLHVHYDRTGGRAYIDIAASPLLDEQGRITHVIEAQRDLTAEWQLKEKLGAVHALGRDLVFARDEAQIAQLVIDTAELLLNFQMCDLLLVDEAAGTLMRRAISTAGPGMGIYALPLSEGRGITVAVAQSGEAIYLPDVSQDSRYVQDHPETRSELCVPLKVGTYVIGVLNAESEEEDAFDEADQQLLSTLADQAALALENARLFEIVVRGRREWETTFDAIADGIALVDADYRIVRINRTLAGWLGDTPQALIGRTCYAVLDHSDAPPEICPHRMALQSGQPQSVEKSVPALEGAFRVSKYPVLDDKGQAVATVHAFMDITEHKRMEQQLLHSERLSAMGKLAASVAHEVNNPLQSVIGCLGLARESLAEGKDADPYLDVVHEEVRRVARKITQLRDLARPISGEKKPADVNDLLAQVLELSRKRYQENRVEVIWQPAADLPLVSLVSDQIKQVFLNLLFNAIEAMPEGGRLQVSTVSTSGPAGVHVAFVDDGVGIAPGALRQIFDPFYSTKEEGLGLGLPISHRIVEEHGGTIEVESQIGEGSTFTVWLPAIPVAS